MTLPEKRAALDFHEFAFEGVLESRHGGPSVVHTSPEDEALFDKMTDDDLRRGRDYARLGQEAADLSNAGKYRRAITTYEELLRRAPFDSLSMMSIGVNYAHLRKRERSLEWLRRALESDPNNKRVQENLANIRQSLGW